MSNLSVSVRTTGNGRAVLTISKAFHERAWKFAGMEPLRYILSIAVCCLMSVSMAQNTGTLRMLIDPGNDFSFIVDKKHRMQQREITLSEGLHELTIWAPTRRMVDTAVFVIANRTSDLVVRLPYSQEYVDYRAELGRYQTKKRWMRTAPLVALAGGLIWTGVAIGKYGKAKDVLEADQKDYDINVDPAAIGALKEGTIPAHNEDLEKARTNLYLASAFTAVSAAATYYISRRTAKWERPIFDDKEKVRFDGLAWLPSHSGGVFMASLTINLAR